MSAARQQLKTLLDGEASRVIRLRALWALHATGGLEDAWAADLLSDADPYVRAWTIQLLAENGTVTDAVGERLATMASEDESPVVRLYLASACQRLNPDIAWPVVEQLVTHEEDAEDNNLPIMYWYAAEPLVGTDKARAARLAARAKLPKVRQFIARRLVEK